MKSLFILTSALLFTANVLAENDPLWMRYPAISPNGETIAFTYKGDTPFRQTVAKLPS